MKDINKYDKVQFDNLLSMMNYTDASRVISLFKNYLREYPTDVSAHLYYAIMLIKIGNLEEAIDVLNLEVVLTSDNYFDIKKRGYLIVKILLAKEKYEECYKYILENEILFQDDEELNTLVLLLLKKKLNLLVADDYNQIQSYALKQIISYKEELALEHIVLNHKNQAYLDGKSQFNEDFPIQKVFSRIRNCLPNEKRMYDELVVDYYIFKYTNSGKNSGKNVNYIKVITLVNTNQIVTMFPIDNYEKLPYTDISLELDSKKTIKKISQIEKFNKRYNR